MIWHEKQIIPVLGTFLYIHYFIDTRSICTFSIHICLHIIPMIQLMILLVQHYWFMHLGITDYLIIIYQTFYGFLSWISSVHRLCI